MGDLIFKEMTVPEFFNINWWGAEVGLGFTYPKSELGLNGKDMILSSARKNGVILKYIESVEAINFFVISVKKIKVDRTGLDDLLQNIKCGDGVLYSTLLRTMGMQRKNLDAALLELKDKGKIKSEKYHHTGKGGRPTEMYFAC